MPDVSHKLTPGIRVSSGALRKNAMYAVVETGGKQYKVAPGDSLQVELLPAEVGATVELDRVLLVGDGDAVQLGQPTVAGARVVAEVVAHEKGDKIIVFRYKRKV